MLHCDMHHQSTYGHLLAGGYLYMPIYPVYGCPYRHILYPRCGWVYTAYMVAIYYYTSAYHLMVQYTCYTI